MSLTLLALLVACSGSPEPSTMTPSPASAPAVGPSPAPAAPANAPQNGLPAGEGFADPGGQHPPIPPENPVWEWNAGGFVSDARWYGEHNWADVRMRIAGHLSAAGRDRARVLALDGDLTAAATACRPRTPTGRNPDAGHGHRPRHHRAPASGGSSGRLAHRHPGRWRHSAAGRHRTRCAPGTVPRARRASRPGGGRDGRGTGTASRTHAPSRCG